MSSVATTCRPNFLKVFYCTGIIVVLICLCVVNVKVHTCYLHHYFNYLTKKVVLLCS